MLEYNIIIYSLLGLASGILTGLLPGLHANNMALIVVTISTTMNIQPIYAAIYIFSCVIAHTFFDFIPSTYIGVPNEATSLSILPAHRMLLKGKAHLAIKLSAVGSLYASVFFVLTLPIFLIALVATNFPIILKDVTSIVIISIIIYLFLLEYEKGGLTKMFYAVGLFLLSGLLGYIVLSTPLSTQFISPFNMLSFGPLFPLLTGLFGISTLIVSIRDFSSIPKQTLDENYSLKAKDYIAMSKGCLSGALVGLLPGVSSGIATVLSSGKSENEERFILTMGTVNTSNAFFNLLALFTLGKARSGAIIQISKIVEVQKISSIYFFPNLFLYMLFAGILVSIFSYFIVVILSKIIVLRINKSGYIKNYRTTMKILLSIILTMILILSGPLGLILCIFSTLLGILPTKLGTQRVHLMGCIILPVLIYFL